MPEIIGQVMAEMELIAHPTLDDLISSNREARIRTGELLKL